MAAQMNRLPGVLNVISQPRNEEDFVDRLNYKTTTYIVLAAALTIFAKVRGHAVALEQDLVQFHQQTATACGALVSATCYQPHQ